VHTQDTASDQMRRISIVCVGREDGRDAYARLQSPNEFARGCVQLTGQHGSHPITAA
jgi:hypothetical protein